MPICPTTQYTGFMENALCSIVCTPCVLATRMLVWWDVLIGTEKGVCVHTQALWHIIRC